MVYMAICGLAQLRQVVSRSDSDTLIARRMREACGLGQLNIVVHGRGDGSDGRALREREERNRRFYSRLMMNRSCNLDG